MDRKLIFICLMAGLLSFACNNSKQKRDATEGITRDFPMVQIPRMITEPSERVDYAIDHIWDGFIDTSKKWLCDSSYLYGVKKSDVGVQAGMYATLLNSATLSHACQSLSSLYDKLSMCEKQDSSSNAFEGVVEFISNYLYDPNSPYRNERLYMAFLQKLIDSDLVSKEKKDMYKYDYRMCSLNNPGSKAGDFSFTTSGGQIISLYSIKSPYILLLFSNPGCPECKEIIDNIKQDEKTSHLIKNKILTIVNIYIDQDIKYWKEYSVNYPKEWYNGYDHNYSIRTYQIYNVRAIPSLYLLDKDKKVILKDATPEKMFDYLNNLEI